MQSLNIFLWLLVAYSIALISARAIDDDLAARFRFDELASDSENDERFNEISDLEDIDEVYFPKRQKSKSITRNWDVSTKRPGDVEELTTEIEKGLVRPMVTTMFSFMRDVMRQVFH